jgi:predicted O-methyltransferase YrrM
MKERVVSLLLRWIERKAFDLRAVQARIDRLGARHGLVSAILSPDDEASGPNDRLLELAEATIRTCRTLRLPDFSDRFTDRTIPHFHRWPGEHYRVLAALCSVLGVRHAVEIGTYTGLGSLAILPHLPAEGSLVTFDIVPWKDFPDTVLRADDFQPGRFTQELADLSDPATALKYAEVLRRADLMFIDAAKDGVQEQKFLDNFEQVGLKPGALLVFDDTKIWNMLAIWRRIRRPKLDFTSFGHFTGTGFVLWA